MESKDADEGVYVVYAEYKCGSRVSFLAKTEDDAHEHAEKIAGELCPICKLRANIELDPEELEALFNKFLEEEAVRAKLN